MSYVEHLDNSVTVLKSEYEAKNARIAELEAEVKELKAERDELRESNRRWEAAMCRAAGVTEPIR